MQFQAPTWTQQLCPGGVQLCIALFLSWVVFYLGRFSATPPLSDLQTQAHHTKIPHVHPDAYVSPFYIPSSRSALYKLATEQKPVSDKFEAHTYEQMYSKYFEVEDRRFQRLKVLEIGLGCGMSYGTGASAKMWRKYFPNSELWIAEYDANCVSQHMPNLKALNISAVTGDQGDAATVRRWVAETGGAFDIIIDDGGHQSHHLYNSFQVLFPQALKPGGIYFLEDLCLNRWASYRGHQDGPVMVNVIKDWVESLLSPVNTGPLDQLPHLPAKKLPCEPPEPPRGDQAYQVQHKLPLGIVSVECSPEMCAFIKCTQDDPRCPVGRGPSR